MRQYRKDIDGLRAIAVLPVVLFHAGLGLPGGFVGVDVFFVISGFLITSLIFQEIEAGRFSIGSFYERRVRRIFPALFAVVAVSSVLAFLLFMPSDLILFGKSLRAAAFFYSNFLFQHEAGYFDALATVKPLLHTWSLAVEEQFYITVPLLLLALRGSRKCQLYVLAGLTLASFSLSEWWVLDKPSQAFYLLPSRFWELGIGALLASAPLYRPKGPLAGGLLSAAGLLLIALATLLFDETTPFPGISATLPVAGAALVILGGFTPNAISRGLGAPPLVFIGLISYSLYLWHWPLLVFSQYELGRALSTLEAATVVVASLLVSTVSWKYIEQPIRHRNLLLRKSSVLAAGFAAIISTSGAGWVVKYAEGFPGRLPDAAARVYAAKDDVSQYSTTECFTDSKLSGPSDDDVRNGRLCVLGDRSAALVTFVVWGDSHSGAMAPAIDRAAQKYGRKGLFVGQGGCPPLINYRTKQSRKSNGESCIARNDAVLDLVKQRHISSVFLVARWPREVWGAEYGKEGPFFDPATPYPTEDRSRLVAGALNETLEALDKLKSRAVLVMDVPEPGYDVPYALARGLRDHRSVDVNPTRKIVNQRQALAAALLTEAARKHHDGLIDPTPLFCDQFVCHVEAEGQPRYVDADHLTETAALGLSGLFEDSFKTGKGDTALLQSQ